MIAGITIARGGSRRLPRKNVRDFCGKPLVAWTVNQMMQSNLLGGVWLSTDDDEIAAIGEENGAEIIWRPDWPDADQVAANRVYLHAIDTLGLRDDDHVFQALPTSPLRLPGDIDRVIRQHLALGCNVIMAAKRRETVMYRVTHPILSRITLFDKGYNYVEGASGVGNCSTVGWYKQWTAGLPSDLDADLDKRMEGLGVPNGPQHDQAFVECQQFQTFEVDTLPEFEFCEALMRHYILGAD